MPPTEKITTKEELNGFVSDVVREVMNAEFEDLKKSNQEMIANFKHTQRVEVAEKPEKGLMAGRFMRAIAFGKGDTQKAAGFARRRRSGDEGSRSFRRRSRWRTHPDRVVRRGH